MTVPPDATAASEDASQAAAARPRRSRGGKLFSVLWALAIPVTVRSAGFAAGMLASAFLAGMVWAVVWPTWRVLQRPEFAERPRRTPALVLLGIWLDAAGTIWLLDPDHGAFPRGGSATAGVLEWLIMLLVPTLTMRWFKERRAIA